MRRQLSLLLVYGLSTALLGGCSTTTRTPDVSQHTLGPIEVLQQARTNADPLVRANAIEALSAAPQAQETAVTFGLVDANEGVRFVAAVSLGDAGRCDLVDLVRPLLDDESASVRAAALYALAMCDTDLNLAPLASMVLGVNATERANAALILGKLGNASAIGMLRSAMGRPLDNTDARRNRLVDLTVAEALVRLGAREHLEEIRASFFGSADAVELVAIATQMAGALGDQGLGHALEQMAFDTGPRKAGPELRMIAVAALGALTPVAAQPEIAMQFLDDPTAQVRAQAATALTWGNAVGQDAALGRLLADNNLQVRISAARAILKRRSSMPHGIDESAPTP